jgi:hypothetical protein
MFNKISFILLGLASALSLSGCTVDRVTEYDYYPAGYYSTTTSPNTYYYESAHYRHRHHGRRPIVGPGPVVNPPAPSNDGYRYQTNTSPNNPVPNGGYSANTVAPQAIVTQNAPQPNSLVKPNAAPADDIASGGYSANTSAN